MTTTDAGVAAGVLDSPVTTRSEARRARAVPLWRRRLVRLVSVVAAIGLWQLLTANHVRVWLRFDTLPTVTEIATAFVNRLGTCLLYTSDAADE